MLPSRNSAFLFQQGSLGKWDGWGLCLGQLDLQRSEAGQQGALKRCMQYVPGSACKCLRCSVALSPIRLVCFWERPIFVGLMGNHKKHHQFGLFFPKRRHTRKGGQSKKGLRFLPGSLDKCEMHSLENQLGLTGLLKRSPFCNHLNHVAFSTPK